MKSVFCGLVTEYFTAETIQLSAVASILALYITSNLIVRRRKSGEGCCKDLAVWRTPTAFCLLDFYWLIFPRVFRQRYYEQTSRLSSSSPVFTSVYFSLDEDGMYALGQRGSPYTFHPISQNVIPIFRLKQFQCRSDWRRLFLVLSVEVVEHVF